jgi:hypothetical protein
MVSDQQLLANFGLMGIPALGVLSAPSLQAETKPKPLEEACLVSAPGYLLIPPVNTHFC